MNVLEEWLSQASAALGLPAETGAVHRDLVLDLARDVAHGVARPAAPLTTFLLGLAAGRASGPGGSGGSGGSGGPGGAAPEIERIAAELSAVVARWVAEHPVEG